MDDLINDIETAARQGLWIVALTSALALPDMCAAVGSENGRTTGAKYKNWVEKYLQPKYPRLNPEELYQMRNSLLHQGTSGTDAYSRLLFVHPAARLHVHNALIGDALVLDLPTFCSDVISSVRTWQDEVSQTAAYQANIQSVIRWHPDGVEPYMVGAPVLS